jgi:hypothetical protein
LWNTTQSIQSILPPQLGPVNTAKVQLSTKAFVAGQGDLLGGFLRGNAGPRQRRDPSMARYRILFLVGFATPEITDRNAAFTVFADLKTAAMSGSSTTAIVSAGISAAKRFGFAFE